MFGKHDDEVEVTPADVMRDAANIGDWMRELESLRWQETLEFNDLKIKALEELPADATEVQEAIAGLKTIKQFRADTSSRIERIRFLDTQVAVAMARARLVEVAALSERFV